MEITKDNNFENILLNKITLVLSFVAIPLVAVSFIRIYETGWMPVFTIHLLFLPVVIFFGIFRKNINFKIKAWFLVILFFIIALFAFNSLSISSQAVPLLMLSTLISSVFLSRNSSLFVFFSSLSAICFFAYLNISGYTNISIDFNKYPKTLSSWINIIAAFSLLMGLFVIVLTNIRNKHLEKLREVNSSLEKALAEIKTLRGIIPICSYCKEILNAEGSWDKFELYLEKNSDAQFSHGICPKCMEDKFSSYK